MQDVEYTPLMSYCHSYRGARGDKKNVPFNGWDWSAEEFAKVKAPFGSIEPTSPEVLEPPFYPAKTDSFRVTYLDKNGKEVLVGKYPHLVDAHDVLMEVWESKRYEYCTKPPRMLFQYMTDFYIPATVSNPKPFGRLQSRTYKNTKFSVHYYERKTTFCVGTFDTIEEAHAALMTTWASKKHIQRHEKEPHSLDYYKKKYPPTKTKERKKGKPSHSDFGGIAWKGRNGRGPYFEVTYSESKKQNYVGIYSTLEEACDTLQTMWNIRKRRTANKNRFPPKPLTYYKQYFGNKYSELSYLLD